MTRTTAIAICATVLGACSSPSARWESSPAHRIELLALRRNPQSGLEDTADDQGLFGANYVYAFRGSDVALDIGVRGGSFERTDGSSTAYAETHAGVRWRFAGLERPLQPYLGAGILWNGRGSTSRRFETGADFDDEDDDVLTWILAQSSPYATLGLDFVLGPLSVGGGLRAVCGDGVDLSARHPDDFALDVFVTLGFGF